MGLELQNKILSGKGGNIMETLTGMDTIKAGTGFMMTLTDAIDYFKVRGYSENLHPSYDHMSCQSEGIQLRPEDIHVDEIMRFENSSDPEDQSILYMISSPENNLKGMYVESYGLYHDDLSDELQQALIFRR